MWFNNAIIYQFTKPFTLTSEEIEQQLQHNLFKPCGSQDQQTSGWVSPIPNTENTVHQSGNNLLLCLKTEEKILPAAVIKEALDQKVIKIASERGQNVGKKEKQTLKEEIIQQLLPKAFSKSQRLYAYINIKDQFIVVNTSSASKAESLLAILRQAIGSLPILPAKAEPEAMITLTHWVKNNVLPAPFAFATSIDLKSLDDAAASANLKNHDVTEDEVQLHINNGKFVHKLGLEWQEKIRFALNHDLTLKQIKFLDLVKEQNDDIPSDDLLAKFDADYTLMAGELNDLIVNILAILNHLEDK